MIKRVIVAAAVMALTAIACWAEEGESRPLTWRERAAQRRQRLESLRRALRLREYVAGVQDAEDDGDVAAARAARERVRTQWQEIGEQFRAAIEARHPGTRDRMRRLIGLQGLVTRSLTSEGTVAREGDTITREASVTTSGGRGATYSGTTKISGSIREHDGTITTLGGKEATVSGTTVREDGTVTHQHTVAGDDGALLRSREGTTTRSDGSVEHEHTITRRDGSTSTVEATHTRTEPGVIEHDRTAASSRGREVTYEGTSTQEGTTITHEGVLAGSGGRTATVDGTTTRDGSTIAHEQTVTGEKGRTLRERQGTTTREGATVSHEHTVTGLRRTETAERTRVREGSSVATSGSRTRERRSYRDDYDLFGSRGPVRGQGQSAADGGRRRARRR